MRLHFDTMDNATGKESGNKGTSLFETKAIVKAEPRNAPFKMRDK